jgi:hypothetical protein
MQEQLSSSLQEIKDAQQFLPATLHGLYPSSTAAAAPAPAPACTAYFS